MPESEKQAPDLLSKSQRKKDMLALQQLGERLAKLADSELAKLPLSDKLVQSIVALRKLKTHESRRRQTQLIGKLMRQADIDAILVAMKKNRI